MPEDLPNDQAQEIEELTELTRMRRETARRLRIGRNANAARLQALTDGQLNLPLQQRSPDEHH